MADDGRTIWLLRHAKARPQPPPGGRDRDRTLTGHGVGDAAALGRLLADPGARRRAELPTSGPDLVVCSSARRTQETSAEVTRQLSPPPEARVLDVLYHAGPADVIEILRTLDNAVTSVLVVGHNPTMGLLAAGERSSGEPARFPTCALTVLRAGARPWAEIDGTRMRPVARIEPPYGRRVS